MAEKSPIVPLPPAAPRAPVGERLADGQMAKEANELARTILESITEAFFALDRNWRFTYLNPQSFVLLGRKSEDLVGQRLWDMYPGLDGSPFEPIYRGAMASRTAGAIVSYFPDHLRWYDVRVYPSGDGGLSVYFRDVSREKEIELSLARADEERQRLLESERAARGEAERAGRVKDEFLATLSHELRTPLNAITGWCEILIRGGNVSPQEMGDGLATIERNALSQAQIIADILDMSSIMAGKVRISVEPVDLGGLVRGAIDTVRPAAEAKEIRLEVALTAASTQMTGDLNRLQQVFWNLLSNAVKFTPRGGRIQLRLDRVDSHLEVKISDSGKGIAADFLPHVFDRFRQADASTTRKHGGLGLGLSIVKQLVEMHGGTVSASSTGPDQGSSFTVMLPVRALLFEADLASPGFPVPAGTMPEKARPPDNALAGLRVLAVDDEPDGRTLVKRLLEEYGAQVMVAESAAEAIRQFSAQVPDVLVSDIGMPGEDGYSLIRRIRQLPAERGGLVPALAVTAYARVEDRHRALLEGFQVHLPKPVNPAELVAKIRLLATAK